jgi:UPF0755 protein
MFKKIVLVGLALALVAGIFLYPKISLFFKSRSNTVNTTQVVYLLSEPKSIEEIAKDLQTLKVLEDTEDFVAVAKYKELTVDRIAAGKYIIEVGSQLRTILNGITKNAAGNGNGESEVTVTFNNCRDIYQLAGKVSKQITVDSTEFVAKIFSNEILDKYKFSKEQIPALFIPNSYQFYYDTDIDSFIDKMAEEFKNFWTTERLSKMKNIGLSSPSQVVTLASIVYSEQSKNESEWPVIAGLYLNRLDKGMKLQSDPTFKFCWGDQLNGVQRLLSVHTQIDCPYNTYRYAGLPPGPIYIPSSKVVDAVLNRQKNDYIFMMAKPDYSGLHDFTVDYADHQKFAGIYQKWLANELKQ